ncbi:MAG: radical SAM protein [Deltaproteobacteria bacterium]|nr:radical SAM protein [Deltaproteobacteria bacterium]
MNTDDLIKKSQDENKLSQSELTHLLSLPPDSADSYRVMAEANRVSKELSGGYAEVHAQFALNLAPCPGNCVFCSFAQVNGVFSEASQLEPEEAVAQAKQFEKDGVNAIFVMTTAKYPFEKFVEISQEIRLNLNPETTLIANVGDQPADHAKKLKAVGPEHTNDEIAEMICFTASFNPSYSGAARRIAIPNTKIAERGMISELRMSQIVAVTRLGMPRTVMGNCTHEPCTLGALAGANLFWAEAGANPRDVEKNTEKGRGDTVEYCKKLFYESGWDLFAGPSRYYLN